MAKSSLNRASFFKYKKLFDKLTKNWKKADLNIVILPLFNTTLKRIRLRGRLEETLSVEEIMFYQTFYNNLKTFVNKNKEYLVYSQLNPKFAILEDVKTKKEEIARRIFEESIVK